MDVTSTDRKDESMSKPHIEYSDTLRKLDKFLASGTKEADKANDILSTVADDMVSRVKDIAVESLMRGTFGEDGCGLAITYAAGIHHAYRRQ